MPRRRKRALKPIDARMIAETFLFRQDLKGYTPEFESAVPSRVDPESWAVRFRLGTLDGGLLVLVHEQTRQARFFPTL